jgi:hypothetical protein
MAFNFGLDVSFDKIEDLKGIWRKALEATGSRACIKIY